MQKMLYWIWLSCACTPDSSTYEKLLSRFDSPEQIYAADEDALRRAVGTRCGDFTALLDKDLTAAKELLDFCLKKKIGLLTRDDERFPDALRNIPHPPVMLYYRGKLPDFNTELCVSVVGARHMSEYGRRCAFRISTDLATAGALIVSGMARGIDAVAAAGAIYAGRPTVAVLGSGIDICYPKEHLTLARRIVEDGCVLTEFPPHTPPHGYHFPKRNRIISGLSVATVVIEGNERSGSLLTARHATAQGRDVYALPGSVDSPMSFVPNLLLRNGAKSLTCADDMIRDYENVYLGKLNPFLLSPNTDYPVEKTLDTLGISYIKKTKGKHVHPEGEEAPVAPHPPSDSESPYSEAPEVPVADFEGFDEEAVALYQKIPLETEIAIEALCDELHPLRKTMKLLLKLEMGRFVTILPGERVKRNFK